eukprot:CAMPEP_0172472986 /NCGR_PEP_ID=MMETSP1065-20121228/68628_1 /TAXON_ID=265537 /ORGANISM="Amphiprora paludosa, Strain CCMP125" /LENGTH=411 /DNA_ID=CAMNT_0013231155 /DNA_START=606 /DNA_END=1841 /DNA_ORIENTATION=-
MDHSIQNPSSLSSTSVQIPSLSSLLSTGLSPSSFSTTLVGTNNPFAQNIWQESQPAIPTNSAAMPETASAIEETAAAAPRRSARLQRNSTAVAAAAAPPEVAESRGYASRKREAEPMGGRNKRARRSSRKPPPNAKDDANYETDEKAETNEENYSCCICMSEPNRQDLSVIDGCDHRFCFDCIAKWADRENTCPLCKVRFSNISRVHKSKTRRGDKGSLNTKHVRSKDQRSDLVSGAALEAMLNSLAATNRSGVRGPRVGHLLFAMGGSMPSARNRSSRSGSRRTTLVVEEENGDSDEDSEGFNIPNFNELMRSTMELSRRAPRRTGPLTATVGTAGLHQSHTTAAGNTWMVPPPPLFSMFSQQPPLPNQRSYAVNVNDSSAGRADNPLEIDDDSSDDEVEILDVTGSTLA